MNFEGVLKVGGRLNRIDLHQDYENYIIPSRHNVAKPFVTGSQDTRIDTFLVAQCAPQDSGLLVASEVSP